MQVSGQTSHRRSQRQRRKGAQFQLLTGSQVYSLSRERLEQAISECGESSELVFMHCYAEDEEVPADQDLEARMASRCPACADLQLHPFCGDASVSSDAMAPSDEQSSLALNTCEAKLLWAMLSFTW